MSQHKIVEMLLAMSDETIDPTLKAIMRPWPEEPAPLQWLEALDKTIHGALAPGMVVATLRALYETALTRVGTTHAEVLKGAVWRTADHD